MLFAGVICPNSLLLSRIAVYAVSVSSLLSVAVPKYFFPMPCASEFRPEPEGAGAPTVEVGPVDVVVGGAEAYTEHGQ